MSRSEQNNWRGVRIVIPPALRATERLDRIAADTGASGMNELAVVSLQMTIELWPHLREGRWLTATDQEGNIYPVNLTTPAMAAETTPSTEFKFRNVRLVHPSHNRS